jgi:sarcosine oxidase delta subunit
MGCRRFLRVERHALTNEIRSATAVGGTSREPAEALSSRSDAGSPDAGGQAL